MSPYCQVNRLLTFEAGRLAQLHQLDVLEDRKALADFQKKLRSRLWEKFSCRYDGGLPLKVKKFGTLRKKDFTITKLIYQSRPGIFVTSLLYEPAGKGPFPAVLQMHGHNREGKFAVNSPWSLLFDARTVNFNAVSPFAKFLPGAIYSLALSIAGCLQWGDVSLAAALGHGTADFVSPRTSDGTPLSKAEIQTMKKETAQVRKKLV